MFQGAGNALCTRCTKLSAASSAYACKESKSLCFFILVRHSCAVKPWQEATYLECRYDKYLQSEQPKVKNDEKKGDRFDRELASLEDLAQELSEV